MAARLTGAGGGLGIAGGGIARGGKAGHAGLSCPPVLRVFHSKFDAPVVRGGDSLARVAAPTMTRKERRRRERLLASASSVTRMATFCPDREANRQVFLCVLPRPGSVVKLRRKGGRGEGLKIRGKVLDDRGAIARTVATVDRSDRAHEIRDEDGFLMPAGALGREDARPRRYPASQMTSRGVAFDSAFDAWHERRVRLEGVTGVGLSRAWADGGSGSFTGGAAVYQAAYEAARRGKSLRSVMERNVEAIEGRMESAESLLERYRRGEWRAEE